MDKLQADVNKVRIQFKTGGEYFDELRCHKVSKSLCLDVTFQDCEAKKDQEAFEYMLDNMFVKMIRSTIKEEYMAKMWDERKLIGR